MTIISKSQWQYIIILALTVRILFIYWPSAHTGNSDAESAIKRAKTDSCKRELHQFSQINTDRKDRIHLKRTCHRDSNLQRNVKIGCALNTTEGLTKLGDLMTNSTYCLEVCFNYGYSHAGYNVASKGCFCGDSGLLKVSGQDVECYGQDWMEWFKIDNGIFKPSELKTSNRDGPDNTKQLRIAFLLTLSGRNVMQVKRLLKNIYSSNHVYYLHVDRRDNYLFKSMKGLEDDHKNIILAKSRFNTIWGGPSLLRMLVDAIGVLSSYEWDYLLNLSESDFPIRPVKDLENYLNTNLRNIYLKAHNIKGYNFIKKQGLDRNFYQCEDRVWRLGKRSLPTGIVYSGGSDWFALPRDFCLYIMRHQNDQESLVGPLLKIYNNTLLPMESFFHTLALNSEFCDRLIDNNLRVTNWHRQKGCKCQHQDVVDWCGCSPHVYRLADQHMFKQIGLHKDLFFARKFDPTISSSILNALEYQLVDRESDDYDEIEEDTDTRHWLNVYDNSEEPGAWRDNIQQFGLFALKQTGLHLQQELRSVHLYFNDDRFIGLIFDYCRQSECTQLLVERQIQSHLHCHNTNCAKPLGFRLNAIEVNHGFDTSERMFRDHRPLSHMSDIVVYHEWFFSDQTRTLRNSTDGVRFSWINPRGSLELAQKIKFKDSTKPVRIFLAHRLATTKPLLSGLWTLSISNHNKNCCEYKFLVFDRSSFDENKISSKQFGRLYQVTKTCLVRHQNHSDPRGQICAHQPWSPSSIARSRLKASFE